ncbi:MAG TPA: acyltransferase [Chthonomonadaceae bacterium]|nr:acyltransferase [Chthonomonadaceae bacterium]
MSIATLPAEAVISQQQEPARLRLDFLDGLRGLAALYVVLYHTVQFVGAGLPPLVLASLAWMRYGRYAVDVFIVLSGYCLMLPVARSADGKLRGGVGEYLKRRARRILPPYYAALALALLLAALSWKLKTPGGGQEGVLEANFAPGVLISHLLLAHNLRFEWAYAINVAMWSVATEWQIYFIFPALLLPVWRRLGNVAVVGVGFLVGLAPYVLLPAGSNLDQARPWFLGLFALGMAGAVVGFSDNRRLRAWRDRVWWGVLALALFGAVCGLGIFLPEALECGWAMDTLVGAATACLIIGCARSARSGDDARRPIALRLLSARGTVLLGAFSYSLYLVHIPLLYKGLPLLGRLHLPPLLDLIARFAVVVPAVLAVSYLFYLVFERPFLPGQRPKKAPLSPRP